MKEAIIDGGATLWARQTIESEIFYNKPAEWFKIWFYLVNRVSHKDTKKYKRGETFLYYNWICDTTKTTKDQVKKCISWLRNNGMVSTRRSTRGVWLKIAKYSHFQRLDNYYYDIKAPDKALEKHQRSTREAPRYNKNDKNDKNDKNITIADKSAGKQINELLKEFEPINPTINYGNKTQRKALEDMLKKFGYEKLLNTIKFAVSKQGEKYAPTITTPIQLKNKLGELLVYYKKETNNPMFVKI